jgi:hypothetical protein
MLKKRTAVFSLALTLMLTLVFMTSALAGRFHFTSVTFEEGSLIMKGTLAGLGNEEGTVFLTAYGTATAFCENKGGKRAPGRNPIAFDLWEMDDFRTEANGIDYVEITIEDPQISDFDPVPTPKEAGCPNGNWTVTGIDTDTVNWTLAVVEVYDEFGTLQLSLSFDLESIL